MSDLRSGRLPDDKLRENFAEIIPPYSRDEAVTEANRCLFCYDAPCIRACPTHIDIPSFIKKISTDNLRGSARVIMDSNPLGLTCARVCPVDQLCEGACVLNEHHRPIPIGRLQRHATDWLAASGETPYARGEDTGRRVAIIGAGPAGLSCAVTLARLGDQPTVFEAKPKGGGLNTYGIVSFREPTPVSLAEVRFAEEMGIEFRYGQALGRDISLPQLLEEYESVFIGTGLGRVPRLQVPGEGLDGVHDALTFIERTKTETLSSIPVGRRVVVVGAGNTAIDAATASVRLGADEVSIVYRRTADEMPAYGFEFEFAKQDGVRFVWLTQPVRVLGKSAVTGLECVRTKLEPAEGSNGRPRPVPIPGSEHTIECDMVIKATGQESPLEGLDGEKVEIQGGKIVVDPETGQTSHPRIFAAGDCTGFQGEATVVEVVEEAKRAAYAIHEASLVQSR